MSPQEKRHGVMARIRTSDLTIKRPMLYHLSYPAIVLLQLQAQKFQHLKTVYKHHTKTPSYNSQDEKF
jgi:hypothetical protein